MKIQHKRSAALDGSTAKEPTAAQTDLGELCVNFNTADPALFIRDNADNIRRVGGDLSLYQKIEDTPPPVFVCQPDEINAQSPPAGRLEGTLWWNTEEGVLYVWYEDGDSEQWVIAVPQTDVDVPPGTVIGEAPPSDPEVGQLWWNSSDDSGRLYVYYEDANSSQWVEASPQVDSLTEEQSDNRYLSKVSDDTAAGTITFEKGVSVTGGDAASVSKGFYSPSSDLNQNLDIAVNSLINARFANSVSEPGGRRNFTGFTSYPYNGITESAEIVYGNISQFQGGDYTSTNNLVGFYTKKVQESNVTGRVVSYKGFEVAQDTGIVADFANTSYGFYSGLNFSDRDTYNFYAEGTAPNYFAGTGTFSPSSDDVIPVDNTGANGISISPNGQAGRLVQQYASTNASGAGQYITRTGSTAGQLVRFYYAATTGTGGATNAGNITLTSATSVNFGTTSDYRLKTNVSTITGATDAVKALKPYAYEFNNGSDVVHQGFFAHELQEQVPMAVTGIKDAVDEDGNPEYQSVDLSKVVPLLTKALQEVMQKNEDLEARIAALEGA